MNSSSSIPARVVIVAVLEIILSTPSINTQLPADATVISDLYLMKTCLGVTYTNVKLRVTYLEL